jgi:uncharacterized BrkB/YihY/UPF0761 family membrane protein
VSLLVTLNSVEAVFNRIWRVRTARPKLSRFLVYWTVLTLGALLVAATSLALLDAVLCAGDLRDQSRRQVAARALC